jgi:hypothetical protein
MSDSYLARITQYDDIRDVPVDPDFGIDVGQGRPTHPIQLPPTPPGLRPDNSLPSAPVRPSQPIFIPETPDNALPVPPGTIWPPIPPSTGASGRVWILIYVVGVGHRWLLINGPAIWPPPTGPGAPNRPDQGLPSQPTRPDQGLPPHAQPK